MSQAKDLYWFLDRLSRGDVNAVLETPIDRDHANAELLTKVKEAASRAREHTQVLDEMASGEFQRKTLVQGKEDLLGNSINHVLDSVSKTAAAAESAKLELEKEKSKLLNDDWLKSNYAKIFSKLQGVKTLKELGGIFLKEISQSTNAQIGSFLVNATEQHVSEAERVGEEEKLTLISTYGCDFHQRKKSFNFGEGIVGQCATDRKANYLEDVPKDFIQVESSLGKISPSCVATIPIIFEEKVHGVFELASLHDFTPLQKRLIEEVASSIGVSIQSISGNMLTEKLLEEIAKKNNSLASQKQALDSAAIVAETNTQGNITYVNDKFLEISKYRREDLLGQDHRILNSGHHPKEFFIDLWRTIARGEVWKAEVKNRAKDGSFYWVDTTVYPIKNEYGKLVKYVAIRFDITDRKQAEEDLTEATQKATQANQIKSEFLANMSHEIRTPLNGILSCTNLLLDSIQGDENTKLLKTVQACGDSLLTVINDILDFSKMEAGKMSLESHPFEIKNTVQEVVELMDAQASDKGCHVSLEIDSSVPIYISSDVTRFRQILLNLVSNAVKFTKDKIRISLTAEESSGKFCRVISTIEDNGIGISPEVQESLFQSFSQADASTTRKFGGTGLGLAICKGLAEAMGGNIWVESELNQGAKFHFSILAEKVESVSETKTPLLSEINPEMANQHPLRILMAEDNTVNQLVAKKMLAKLGYRIDVVANGIETLEALKQSRYDMILMDQHMPEMDGIEATQKIIEMYSTEERPRIIALTASAFKEDRDRCLGAGMDGFLSKPIKMNEMVHELWLCKSDENDEEVAS